MSAPDTNTKTEAKRHRPSLLGMGAIMVYSTILIVAFGIYLLVMAPDETGEMGSDDIATTPEGTETEEALEGYEEGTYAPGGNDTGTVEAEPAQ
ncbi:hypothetical protein [Roseivivax sp. CAU 1761]